jgi:hypothetical protein
MTRIITVIALVVLASFLLCPYTHAQREDRSPTCENNKPPRTFHKPKHNGYRLDVCFHWGTDCGERAANAWCWDQGYARASEFEVDPHIGAESPTWIFGDGTSCEKQDCDGFKYITCTCQ